MTESQKLIYQTLITKYQKSAIGKQELAHELDCSVSLINLYLSQGTNLPNYKKSSGNGNGGRVYFPLHEVAIFLSQTTKVA